MNAETSVLEQVDLIAHKNTKLIGTDILNRIENLCRRKLPDTLAVQETPKPNGPAMPDFKFIALCKEGKPEAIRKALNEGANVNAKNHIGETALMFAVKHNNRRAVRAILDAGPDINARGYEGQNALMYAARFNNDSEIIRLLLYAGADVNAKDSNGWTPLMSAVRYNNPSVILNILQAFPNVNAQNNRGITALMIGAEVREPEIVNLLLSFDAKPNARTYASQSVLMYTVQNRKALESSQVIEALLDAGAGIDVTHEVLMAADRNIYLSNSKALERLEEEYKQNRLS